MPLPPAKPSSVSRRAVRWLLPAAVLAFTPKCVICVLAYAGLGTALGIGGPEWCSAADGASTPISWTTMLAWTGAALVCVIGTVRVIASCRHERES